MHTSESVGGLTETRPMNYGERIDAISARLEAAYAARQKVWRRHGQDGPEAAEADAAIELVYDDLRALNKEMLGDRG